MHCIFSNTALQRLIGFVHIFIDNLIMTASTMADGTTISSLAVPSGLSSQNLLLDSDIRDWVVLPLLVIMIAAGLLRQSISVYLRSNSKPLSPIEARAKSCIQRAARLRSGGGGYITSYKWESRRRYLSSKNDDSSSEQEPVSLLREEAVRAKEDSEAAKSNGDALDMMNPMSMMDGLKGQMAFMVQNMVMMQGISHFFQGFVLVKVPFPLTNGFKMMFQRGLDLSTLETSYVSSVSWYFLVMFGLRAFFRLAIGDTPQETQEAGFYQHSMGTLINAPAGPQKFDSAAVLKGEADNLEITKRPSMLDDVEKRLLGAKRYPKKKVSRGSNPGDDIFGYVAGSKKGKSAKK